MNFMWKFISFPVDEHFSRRRRLMFACRPHFPETLWKIGSISKLPFHAWRLLTWVEVVRVRQRGTCMRDWLGATTKTASISRLFFVVKFAQSATYSVLSTQSTYDSSNPMMIYGENLIENVGFQTFRQKRVESNATHRIFDKRIYHQSQVSTKQACISECRIGMKYSYWKLSQRVTARSLNLHSK